MSDIEATRRESYDRGLGVGLFWMAAFFSVYTAGWTMAETPKYRRLFEQLKAPLPEMTVLFLDYYAVAAAGLMLGVAAAAALTFIRKVPGKAASQINGLLFVLAMGLSSLSSVAIKTPLMELLQGLGTGR